MFEEENKGWKQFKLGLFISFIFIALLWVVKFLEISLSVRFVEFGILPKTISGLKGILFAPVIHGDFDHLISNSLPLLILGTILFNSYPKVAWRVILLSYFIVGFLVWLTASGVSFHIGASGLVYGLAFFLLASGLFRKDRKSTAITLVVTLFYGGLIWGVIPIANGISWESHLYGALVGILTAFLYRKIDLPREIIFEEEIDPDLHFFEWEEKNRQLPPPEPIIKYIYKEKPKNNSSEL